ncbi:hypothetical protein ACO0LM_11965 [Undibacterium sp. Di26W]|uniref:hypothetical protein n=1 Tax=Undibacterium sp. Di26W TaxID=3413035 RepID=UPI003BF4158B
MSLETVIQENTTAINSLIALLSSGVIAASSGAVETSAPPADTKPEATKKVKDKAAKTGESTNTSTDTANAKSDAATDKKQEAETGTDTPAIAYEVAQKKILEAAKEKGREAVVELLGNFGATKGTDLKPAQYAPVIAAIEALLAGDGDLA